VQDTQGAIIPGAQVTLINQDQGVEARQTITNEAGIYLFSALPAATYTVTVELPGFKTYKKTDVKLFVNDKLGLPEIRLEVGSQAESITVEAQSVQLETVSGERSGVVTGRQMADIALKRPQLNGPLQDRSRRSCRCGFGHAQHQWPAEQPDQLYGGRPNFHGFRCEQSDQLRLPA